jgi:hypothetical protein
MKMSQAHVYAAFVAAQRAFGPALKAHTNPVYRSKYADLSACIEAVIDGLHAHGFALMQATEEREGGAVVETLFLHESGERISGGKLFVPASKPDAHGVGSALTYARRYSLLAACGLAPEDDDANKATGQGKSEARPAPATRTPSQAPQGVVSASQAAEMEALLVQVNGDAAKLLDHLGVSSFDAVPAASFERVMSSLRKKVK